MVSFLKNAPRGRKERTERKTTRYCRASRVAAEPGETKVRRPVGSVDSAENQSVKM
jgi:hypothetical protein